MHPDTDPAGTGDPVTDRTEGDDLDWGARFEAELRAQLDASGTLFGDDADGAYWAIRKHDRCQVVPGTGGRVAAPEN